MKFLILSFCCPFAFVINAFSQSVVPAELEQLRNSYEAASLRVTRPVDEKYLMELRKLQDRYTKAAKLTEALTVSREASAIVEKLGLSGGKPLAVSEPALMPLSGSSVTIYPNDPNSCRLGRVNKGDTITVQYVSGMWKNHGHIATENPDSPKAGQGEENSLVFAEAADEKGSPGKTIKVVPTGTQQKPFVYVVQTTRNDLVLRINSNSNSKDNPGSVVYSIKISR